MVKQVTWFEKWNEADTPKLPARKTDPVTSKVAARSYVQRGKADADRQLILEVVKKNPGSTAGEIAGIIGAGWTNVRVSRRVNEMPELEYGNARICAINGTLMKTIWMVKAND